MFAIKSIGFAVGTLWLAFVLAQPIAPPSAPAEVAIVLEPWEIDDTRAAEIVRSLRGAAETMRVEIDEACVVAITTHVQSYGYDRGGVTNRGSVIVRDARGVAEWVCL